MMKKRIIFGLVFGLLLISTVTAGVLDVLARQDRTVDFSVTDENYLKTRYDIPKIEIETSEILCDDTICWAEISQEGLIHTRFKHSKTYCSDNNGTDCLAYSDYTSVELRGMVDEFIKMRLTTIINTDKNRTTITNIDGAGTITRSKR